MNHTEDFINKPKVNTSSAKERRGERIRIVVP